MRAHLMPPPARHPFGACARVGWTLLLLGAAGLAVLGAWLVLGLGYADRAPRAGGALLLWTGCTALAWRWWRTLPRGELVWDGTAWTVTLAGGRRATPLAVPPEVRLDLQSALLLYARPAGARALWLWLVPVRAPAFAATWLPMRRALYSRAPAAPAQDDEPRPSNETPA